MSKLDQASSQMGIGTSVSSPSLQLAMRWLLLLSLISAFLLEGGRVRAEIDECVDEDSLRHHTDATPNSHYMLFIRGKGGIEIRYSGEDQFDGLIDEDGVTHHTNTPASSQYILFIKGRGGIEIRYSGEDQFDALIQEAAGQYGVDPALVKAIIRAESGFDPWAISRKGAIGLMQLLPETAQRLSVSNIFDPQDNIYGGVKHFKELLDTFQNDVELSLAAYNAGKSAVLEFKSVPPYEETQDYVKKVLRFYQTYVE